MRKILVILLMSMLPTLAEEPISVLIVNVSKTDYQTNSTVYNNTFTNILSKGQTWRYKGSWDVSSTNENLIFTLPASGYRTNIVKQLLASNVPPQFTMIEVFRDCQPIGTNVVIKVRKR